MASENINVSLNFTAQTGQAKASIQELQMLLNKIAAEGVGINKNTVSEETKAIRDASNAAIELQNHLNNAFNVKTGKFDLSLFDKSLKSSGDNITNLTNQLLKSGDVGQQAFVKLAQSISLADQPMFRINSKLQDFASSLKKTMSWQLSNNVIRGFMGAIQTAYGYAQDLNASLTDIRIVTGKSSDEMARFAEQANKAAKALNTTTTDYTKGSLIYFQQGLSDQEVSERTETTLKMANVTGDSTSKVADQMTAIWNNFADGSKELSYYADVITALGAATASSSDEISEGINKFAATAKTVGLSYEYATAALATVTARTRESADVVGNAFRTLFARIQGLNQGDTLDDGTTLNKYSSALAKVGVNIKTASGELKGMDDILDELGPKWKTLADAQKMALAQAVAGVRQYGQFMALMNNYDYFKENVSVAEESTGTLQKQADIYAESWEAASKRVRASAESLYQDLIDDKFFISINNGIANVLSGLDAFIDKAGGLKTVITAVSGVFLSAFASKIPDAIKTAKYNLEVLTGGSQKAYQNIFKEMQESTNKAFSENKIDPNSSMGMAIKQANALSVAKTQYKNIEDQLSESEKQQYSTQINLIEAEQKQIVALKERNEELKKGIELQSENLKDKDFSSFNKEGLSQSKELAKDATNSFNSKVLRNWSETYIEKDILNFTKEIPNKLQGIYQKSLEGFKNYQLGNTVESIKVFENFDESSLKELIDGLKIMSKVLEDTDLENFKKEFQALSSAIDPTISEITGLSDIFEKAFEVKNVKEIPGIIEEIEKGLKEAEIPAEEMEKILKAWNKNPAMKKFIKDTKEVEKNETEISERAAKVKEIIGNIDFSHAVQGSEALSAAIGGIASSISAVASIWSYFSALKDPNLTLWEKMSTAFLGLSSSIGLAKKAYESYLVVQKFFETNQGLITAQLSLTNEATNLLTNSLSNQTISELALIAVKGKKNNISKDEIKLQMINHLKTVQGISDDAAKTIAETISTGAILGKVKALKLLIAEQLKASAAFLLAHPIILAVGVAIAGLTAATILAVNAQNANAKAAKEAAEAAKESAEGYNEAKTAYTDLLNTVSSIKEEKKALDEMTEGTQEWKDAVSELNDKVMQLVALYPELAAVVTNVNGVLGIDFQSEVYQNFIEKRKKQIQNKNSESYGLEVMSLQASNKNKISNFSQSSGITEGNLQKVLEAYLNNPVGDLFTQEGLSRVIGESEYLNPQREAIIQNSDAIIQLAQSLNANTDAISLNSSQIAGNYLGEDTTPAEKTAVGQALANAIEENGQNWKKKYYDTDKKKNLNDKEVQEAYAQEMGYEWISNNNNGTGTYRDASGQQIDINDETARYYLNQKKWLNDNAPEITQEVSDFFTGLGNEDLVNLIQSAISGDKKALTKGALDLDSKDFELLTSEQKEYLRTTFGNNIEDTIKAFLDLKPEDINKFDLDSWTKKYSEKWNILSKLSYGDKISEEDYNKLGDAYQEYFQRQIDGTYKLITEAEKLKNIVQETDIDELKPQLERRQDVIEYLRGNGDNQTQASTIDASINNFQKKIEDNTLTEEQAKNYLNSNYGQALQNGLKINAEDYDSYLEALQKIIEAWNDVSKAADTASKTAQNLNQLQKLALGDDSFSEGLINLASSYEDCSDELADYLNIIKKYGKSSNEAKNASLKLQRAIRSAEWKKVAKDCGEYIKELSELKDPGEIINSYKKIAQSFNNTFDTNITADFVKDNIKLFEQWANAGEDQANDLGQQLYYLANIANTDLSQLTIDLDLNADGAFQKFDDIQSVADYVTNYVNSQHPTVDVNGRADLSQMITEMVTTGATAKEFAAALQFLGETGIDCSAWGTGFAAFYPSTLEGMTAFVNDLLNFKGSFNVSSNGSAEEAAKAFEQAIGSKKTYGVGGSGGSAKNPSRTSSGGGGGSKSTSHANTKSFSDKDRYHTVKNQLEDLNAQYDALDKAKDRAFGKNKIKEMDAEIAKTDELINKQKEYLGEIENYLPTDKAIMEQAYNEYIGGPGIEYDALGNISNFNTIQDAMFNKYNSMASAYTDDSDEWKAFEKKYELLENYITQYEETYDLLRDERDKMQELINQKIDLGLEKVQYQVEVALDVPDTEIKVLEYKLGRIDDDATKSLEAVSLLTKQAEQVYDKIQLNKQALNDVLKLSMSAGEIAQVLAGDMSVLAGKTLTEDQIDAIKDYRDALIDLNGEFDDLRSSVQDKVMTVFDDWRDKLNTGIETIDHYSSTLESYRNIIDIVGKDTLGITSEFMNKLAQSTVDVAIDKLKGTKKTYETIMESRAEAEKQLQAAQARNDEASIKFWQDSLTTINEEVRSSNEEMMQAWEDALSSIADNFEKTVDDLVNKFQKSVYALGGLDGLSDDFSRKQDEADMMLDDYQKIYELSKLARDVNKTIDDTDIISGKQKLKKLLGQINDLQADGNEMSKYDLEYLQKTYDLRLAEIELEEAQRAKNTVRLQKDSEGNWSYIYTQSSDAIDSAQQKYEDALYAMQDLSSNYIDEMSEKLISTSQDMEEALAAIRIQDYASIDDYYAEVERVQKQYQEQMDMQQNELQKAIDNNKELYDTDWTNYHEATGYKISDTQDFVTSFKDSLLGTLMDSESDTANFTDIISDSVYNLTLGLRQAAETYYKNIEDAMNAAGTSTGSFAEDAGENIDKVVEKSHEGTEAVNDMANQMTSAFDAITESVGAWQENYGMAMEKIIQSNLDVVESFNNMLAALSIDPNSITVKYDIANSAKDQKASSFDTGGYTGEWGTVGKLAVLHQKEMVLNENDTANMLAAVQFTRSILDTIDINARAASLGLGTLSAATLRDDKQQVLQQDVHITAEFPNVNDHNEIEEAFNNLINQASQYVNRK